MPSTLVIGFSGYKQSGKNHVAALVTERLKGGRFHVEQYAFADEVKRYADMLWNWDFAGLDHAMYLAGIPWLVRRKADFFLLLLRLDPRSKKVEPGTRKRRFLLQRLGTDVFRRHVKDSYWVDCMNQKIRKKIFQYSPDVALLTDVRFPNEAEVCDIVVRVRGPEDDQEGGHASENPDRLRAHVAIDNTDHTRPPLDIDFLVDTITCYFDPE